MAPDQFMIKEGVALTSTLCLSVGFYVLRAVDGSALWACEFPSPQPREASSHDCLQESLQVVYHRFSDGVDVLKCVSGFIKVCWCGFPQ